MKDDINNQQYISQRAKEKQEAIDKVCDAVTNATLVIGIDRIYRELKVNGHLNAIAASKAYGRTSRDMADALSYGIFAQYNL